MTPAAVTAVAVGVLLVPVVAAARLIASMTLRRVFPRIWVGAAIAVAVWVLVLAALTVTAPRVLWALATLTALAALVLLAPRLIALARSRHLPPGSLSVARSIAGLGDRNFYLDASRRYGPVFRTTQFHRPAVCVVGLDRGHRILSEHANAIATPALPFSAEIPGGFLRYMDAETHAIYGPLFRRALSPSVAALAGPAAAVASRRELQALAARCERTAAPVPPGDALERVAYDGLAQALLGIVPGSGDAHELRRRGVALAAHPLSTPLSEAARASLADQRAFLRERIGRAEDDQRSAIDELRALDAAMPDRTCLDNLLLTLKIASDNIAGLLHWALFRMEGDHWPERLRAATVADGADVPDLVDRFVMETLRLGQSEYLYRRATDDLEVEGHVIPAGWLLRVCVAESHRDPATFPDPDGFDPDRFATRRFTSSEYAPFGWGRHACNGVALTNVVCRAFLTVLVTEFDVTVTGGGTPVRSFRHWQHWRPGRDLAVRIVERKP